MKSKERLAYVFCGSFCTHKISLDVLEKLAEALSIETHELFFVTQTPENAMERLHKDIIKEIRQVIVEVLETALADKHK